MNDQDLEIVALLGRMNKWWVDNPFLTVRIDTVGRYVNLSGTMYYYVDASNQRRYVGEVRLTAPYIAHYIFTVIDGVGYYQFPDSDAFISDGAVIAYETFLQAKIGDLTQVNVMLNASKVRGLRQTEGRNELFVTLDAGKLGINPPSADIDQVIEYDATPRIARVRQRRLGLEQISTYNYLTTNRNEVLAAMPPLPPLDQARRDVTFDAALKRDILHFRMLQSQGA